MTDTTFTYNDKKQANERLLSYGNLMKKNQEDKTARENAEEKQGE